MVPWQIGQRTRCLECAHADASRFSLAHSARVRAAHVGMRGNQIRWSAMTAIAPDELAQ
jgi:hypothetical protein